jgi:hypothetical protein
MRALAVSCDLGGSSLPQALGTENNFIIIIIIIIIVVVVIIIIIIYLNPGKPRTLLQLKLVGILKITTHYYMRHAKQTYSLQKTAPQVTNLHL